MWYYKLIGIDANGIPYDFCNETLEWTRRGFRKGSTEVWVFEEFSRGEETPRLVYYWGVGMLNGDVITDASKSPTPPILPEGYVPN